VKRKLDVHPGILELVGKRIEDAGCNNDVSLGIEFENGLSFYSETADWAITRNGKLIINIETRNPIELKTIFIGASVVEINSPFAGFFSICFNNDVKLMLLAASFEEAAWIVCSSDGGVSYGPVHAFIETRSK